MQMMSSISISKLKISSSAKVVELRFVTLDTLSNMLSNQYLLTEEHQLIHLQNSFSVAIDGALLMFGDLDLLWGLFSAYGSYNQLVIGGSQTFVTSRAPLQRCLSGLTKSRGTKREYQTNILYSLKCLPEIQPSELHLQTWSRICVHCRKSKLSLGNFFSEQKGSFSFL